MSWGQSPTADLVDLIAECRAHGFDPVPILVRELRAMGYTVTPPEQRPARPALELCADPDCPQAWAYRHPPRPHYHPVRDGRPPSPLRDEDITSHPAEGEGEETGVDWGRFGLEDRDPPP